MIANDEFLSQAPLLICKLCVYGGSILGATLFSVKKEQRSLPAGIGDVQRDSEERKFGLIWGRKMPHELTTEVSSNKSPASPEGDESSSGAGGGSVAETAVLVIPAMPTVREVSLQPDATATTTALIGELSSQENLTQEFDSLRGRDAADSTPALPTNVADTPASSIVSSSLVGEFTQLLRTIMDEAADSPAENKPKETSPFLPAPAGATQSFTSLLKKLDEPQPTVQISRDAGTAESVQAPSAEVTRAFSTGDGAALFGSESENPHDSPIRTGPLPAPQRGHGARPGANIPHDGPHMAAPPTLAAPASNMQQLVPLLLLLNIFLEIVVLIAVLFLFKR
jgi:hypothetical protein